MDTNITAHRAYLNLPDDVVRRAEILARVYNLPPYNLQGDPLATCEGHPMRLIYAVPALRGQRNLCAECRGVA